MNPINPALNVDALIAKSTLYIKRALMAKDSGDNDEYFLWATLSLELLGKSALAKIHPSLIADPNHFQSLFAACNHPVSTDVKTIGAKTVFERLSHLDKRFDKRAKTFCEQSALRRNAELHSGECPFMGINVSSWEKQFWGTVEIILKMQSLTLDEWMGTENSSAPKQLIEHVKTVTQAAVFSRIDNAKEDFKSKYPDPAKRKCVIESSTTMPLQGNNYYYVMRSHYDSNTRIVCPSCESSAFIFGTWLEDVLVETDYESSVEIIDKLYGSDEFYCPVCELKLHGQFEIESAELPEVFIVPTDRVLEYEPEYGND